MGHEHTHGEEDAHVPEARPRLTRGKRWFLVISTGAILVAWFFAERGWNPLNNTLLAGDRSTPPAGDPTQLVPSVTPTLPDSVAPITPGLTSNPSLANCPQGSVGIGIIRQGGAAWIAAEESIPDPAGDNEILDKGYLYHVYRRNGAYVGVIDPVTWDITATDPNSEAVRDTYDEDFACAVTR